MSLDRRTRVSSDIRTIDIADWIDHELPTLLAEHGHLAAPGAAELGVRPFTFAVDAGAVTMRLDAGRITAERGDTGEACVRLGDDDLVAVINDTKTPMTFVTGGTLDMVRGNLGNFLDWWVVLRSLVDGRAVHTRGSVDFRDRDGGPLHLHRGFTPDDDDADIAHFLAEAGFLHLRGWFDEEQMAAISADMDTALPTYAEGDGRSWWAGTADGRRRCVRMQWFDEHSPATRELLESPQLSRISALSGDGHRTPRFGGSRIEALEKPIGVVEGISDVPWHKDCSLGMHSFNCCSLTIGVSVTGADERSGQLRVVAGSHRALVQPAFVREEWGLPVIDLPTATGDVTVHCSCTLHMAQPPADRERRVLYTGLALPPREKGGAYAESLKEIRRVREGSYLAVSQAPAGN